MVWYSLSLRIFQFFCDPHQDEFQAGIKTGERNINNLRYVDDTTLAESKEELKSLFMRLKEDSERADLKLNLKKNLR